MTIISHKWEVECIGSEAEDLWDLKKLPRLEPLIDDLTFMWQLINNSMKKEMQKHATYKQR